MRIANISPEGERPENPEIVYVAHIGWENLKIPRRSYRPKQLPNISHETQGPCVIFRLSNGGDIINRRPKVPPYYTQIKSKHYNKNFHDVWLEV